MKTSLQYTLIASLCVCFLLEAFSKTDQTPNMPKAPVNVKVDGKLNEWGDTLTTYNAKARLSYTIASNDTSLFIAVLVTDNQLKRQIMMGGITVSVNGEGKKHKTCSVTYPMPDKAAFANRNHDDDVDGGQRPSLIGSTSIKVAGFKEVESEVITTSNTYGFEAAVRFDDSHNLAYEIAIPLKLLHLKGGNNKHDALAINIALNGTENSSGHSGMRRGGVEGGGIGGGGGMGGGMPGGGMSGSRRSGGTGGHFGTRQQQEPETDQTTDFWVQLALAPR